MNIFIDIWRFIFENILQKPQYLMGIIVFGGYLLLKRKWYEALSGFIKATIGYMILMVGSTGLIESFRPILVALKDRFELNATVIDPYFGQNAMTQVLKDAQTSFSSVIWLLLIAFSLNLLFVRFSKFTKMRAVFLTGHIQVQQAATAFYLIFYCFPNLNQWQYLIIMSILLSLYWAVGTNLTVDISQELTEGANFCVAHQQMFGLKVATMISSRLFQKNKKKLEDIELPGFLSIFNDNMVSTGLLMLLFFGTILILIGPSYISSNQQLLNVTFTQGEDSFFFFILERSLYFAVYLAILQLGIRSFIGELTYAFAGISEKLLPGAILGIDCAAMFSFGSLNAVTIGFIFGGLGQFIAIGLLLLFKSPILIIAGFIPMFFDNATIAVFANSKGGYKAAILMPFISGLLQVFGSAFIVGFIGIQTYGGYLGMWDWAVIWPSFTVLMYYGKWFMLVLIAIVLILIPQIQYRRNKKTYFLISEDYEQYEQEKGGL